MTACLSTSKAEGPVGACAVCARLQSSHVQVLLATELYQPIRRLVTQERQSVVLVLQLLYLVISLRHFHGRCAVLRPRCLHACAVAPRARCRDVHAYALRDRSSTSGTYRHTSYQRCPRAIHWWCRHISESILSAAWIQRFRAARILQFLLIDRTVSTAAIAGALPMPRPRLP